ncbi:MAG: hypothetical protein H0X04_00315 [Chthoniobacterales bacterium]|nr:hypothetical protein [Chthoniobacterales bacterium]
MRYSIYDLEAERAEAGDTESAYAVAQEKLLDVQVTLSPDANEEDVVTALQRVGVMPRTVNWMKIEVVPRDGALVISTTLGRPLFKLCSV